MLVNAIVLGAISIFLVYCIWDACRHFIGRNPDAPGFVKRIRAWWPGFVKRHIVDNDPFDHEDHASTRYGQDYIDWSKVPKRFDWVAVDPPDGACPNTVWAYDEIDGPRFTNSGWKAPENTRFVFPFKVHDSSIIGPLPPWRESLRHRP